MKVKLDDIMRMIISINIRIETLKANSRAIIFFLFAVSGGFSIISQVS